MRNPKHLKNALAILIAAAFITPATLFGQFIYPISGSVPSGGQFGDCRDGCSRRHEGLDISGSTGTHVGAGYGGTASFVGVSCGLSCGYGRLVILNHASGYQTYYGHLDTFIVSTGQGVSQNQDIARRGNTGGSTGPHVHYEIRLNGTALYIPGTAGQSITRNTAIPQSYPGLSSPVSRWYFDTGPDGWSPASATTGLGWTASGWPGIIYADQIGNDAYWHSPGTSFAGDAEHSINVDVYPQSGSSANHDMQIFWKTSQDNSWTAGKSSPVVNYTLQNGWSRINLDVGAWSGTVNQIRLDFDQANSGTRWIVNHVYTQKTPKYWFGSSASSWSSGGGLSGVTWTGSGWPGVIYADQTGNDAYFVGPGNQDYLGGINDVVRVRIFPQNGTTANHDMQIFWATESSGFSAANSSPTITYVAKDTWADLTIPVGHKPEWNGHFIRQLRVDVDGVNQGNRWIIDYVAVSHLTVPTTYNPAPTAPAITTQPASQTVAQGSSATFSVVATGTAPLAYQWRFNGANISGATASSYTKSNAQTSDAGNYSVVVSNAGGSVTSANASLTVNVPPSITTQPASQTVAQGGSATFSVVATGSGLTYQWRFNGANISGANASSYTKSNAQASDAGNYSVVVSNAGGSVTSANAVLTVTAPPSITAQPQSQSTTAGANVTFNVTAVGSVPLSYQWRFNGVAITGATASSLVKNNVQPGDIGYYDVVVTNPYGTTTSSTATLSFSVATVFTETFESGNLNNWTTASGAQALVISTAQNHTSGGANSALLDVSADRMYHNLGIEVAGRARVTFWIYDDSGAQTRWFGEVRGYTGAGFGDGGLDQLFAIGRYSVSFGTGTGTLASEVVNTTKYQGRVVSGANTGWFNLNANRSTGWHKFEIEKAADGTTIHFYVDGVLDRTITGAVSSTWDSVTMSSVASGTTAGNAWFDDVSVQYYDGPSISTQPASQTVSAGTVATLSVVGTPNISSYQWRKNGVNISGATASSLVFTSVQSSDEGTYSVIVRNGIGIVTSANAVLTVTAATANNPPVLGAIGNRTVNESATLTFTASANDPDAGQTLAYSLDSGNPAGSSINASSGAFTWTPTEAQGGANYTITVRVTDSGTPALNDFETITVTVNKVNSAPVLAAIGNKNVNELSVLSFTAVAADSDIPANALTYSLDAGNPAGSSINSSSGAFTWTPTEAQGPGSYPITVRVTDNGSPALNDFETITVTVNEANTAPTITLGNARVTEKVVNFESIVNYANDVVMFRRPVNSSTTSAFIDTAATNYTMVITSGIPTGNPNAGSKVLKAGWTFKTGTTNPWLRLVTANPVLIPNPTIDFGARLKFDIHSDKSVAVALGVRETGTTAAIGANGGITGPIEWLGATKNGSTPVPNRTVNANTWTTLEFNLPAEVCSSFVSGDGILATGFGVLEQLVIVPNGGMGAYTIHLDNFEVVKTPALPGTVTMTANSTMTFTASSTDADTPAQTLTYGLDAGNPAGSSINSASGAFTWTPSATGTFNITARVTDNGPGNLSDPETFTVNVSADPLGVQSVGGDVGTIDAGETVTLSWAAQPGGTYQVQYRDASSDGWSNLGEPITTDSNSGSVVVSNDDGERYFRIVEIISGASSE
jgi:hypothetical protein